MQSKSAIRLGHVAAWLVFILLPLVFTWAGHLVPSDRLSTFFAGHLIRSAMVIALFYSNYHYLLPALLLQRRRALFLLYNLILLILSNGLLYLIHKLENPLPLDSPRGGPVLSPFFLTLVVGVMAPAGIRLYQRLQATERKRTEMELSYLKSRLNPHFLFNTLNSIYALAVKKSDYTPDAIARLASIMRYVITESDAQEVLLGKELEYIRDFINLQRLRLTEKTTVEFRVEGITAAKMIVPLLLISLVENAFKYGVSTEQDSTISILIDIRGDLLNMKVRNPVFKKPEPAGGEGLGLGSTRQMLEHFYKGRYSLEVMDGDRIFEVNLRLELA